MLDFSSLIVSFSSDFLEFYHLALICHLGNAEIFDISVVMVLSPSEAHRLGEIFEIYVCKGHCVFQVCPLPRKLLGLFRCMAVIYLGVYLFPGEAVSLLRRVLLATL